MRRIGDSTRAEMRDLAESIVRDDLGGRDATRRLGLLYDLACAASAFRTANRALASAGSARRLTRGKRPGAPPPRMGRPRMLDAPQTLAADIPGEYVRRLDARCDREKIGRSEGIRRAVAAWVAEP